MAYSRKIGKNRNLRKRSRNLRKKSRKGGGAGDDMGHRSGNPTGDTGYKRATEKPVPLPPTPAPVYGSNYPPPSANNYVFICSTITPNLLKKYASVASNVTFGSMVYNLESIFGCGFQRGEPIQQNLVYLPVFLEAAKRCNKIGVEIFENYNIEKAKEQNEIYFMKKVLELLEIDITSIQELDNKQIKKKFVSNLNINLKNSLIDKYNIGEIKTMSDTVKNMKHTCSP